MRADLNNDRAVNLQDVEVVASHLPGGQTCAFAMPFSTFTAGLSITGKAKGFDLNSSFSLNFLSNGINLATESVSLKVGDFDKDSKAPFHQLQNGAKQGGWVYDGGIGGATLSVQVVPLGGTAYQLKATASGASLGTLTNPVSLAPGGQTIRRPSRHTLRAGAETEEVGRL